MSTKVLIVGSKGMAGHVIYHHLKTLPGLEVVDVSRNDQFFASDYKLDVTDFGALSEVIAAVQPHFVINCIGLLNATAENNPDQAVLLNSYLPHFLARQCTAVHARLIHISTDCVFNGKKGNYTETDPKDGSGFYAQTKALGEVDYGNHLTIRTSIIGPELKNKGIGLLQWFLNQTGTIKGYSHAYWSGVTTLELAKVIAHILANQPQLSGLIHLTNGSKISKFDLLSLFKEVFLTPVSITAFADYRVDKSLADTKKSLRYTVPGYAGMVAEMYDWMKAHAYLYKNNDWHYAVLDRI